MTTQRVQRFQVGDTVVVSAGGITPFTGTIEKIEHPPTTPTVLSGGCGNSAKYWINGREVWDWMIANKANQ